MPHAQKTMAPQVNGDRPSSVFLEHLTSYPLISDSISTYKSHPYGEKSLSLTHNTLLSLSRTLSPFLSTPFAYLSPYLHRADTLGDSTLSSLESRFPAVKKPTGEIVEDGKKIVFAPLRIGNEGREYLVREYRGQVQKAGEGIGERSGEWVKWPVAAIATGVVVAKGVVGWVGNWLGDRSKDVKEIKDEKVQS